MKYLNLLVFAVLVAASSYLFDEYFVVEKSAAQRASFEQKVLEDFAKLKTDKQLPAELGSVKEIFVSDHRARKAPIKWDFIAKNLFPKSADPSGARYNLQIEAFDDTKDPITVLQLSLYEVDNKNKVWELSRTFASPAAPVAPAGPASK